MRAFFVGRTRIAAVSYKEWRSGLESGKISVRGLAAGNNNDANNFKGKPPYLVGRITRLTPALITRKLEEYERQIAGEAVENAIIITANGEIYRCSGGLNGISIEYFEQLSDKLKGAQVTHNHPVGSDNDYTFSDDDFSLFINFKLARLRGIDEKYVYELNRNAEEVEFEDTDIYKSAEDGHKYIAALMNGVGYRRWERG